MKTSLTRRDFLGRLGVGAVALAGAAKAVAGAAEQGRPNVLFVPVDDLNDWVGCLGGHPQAKTPHVDQLAGRGVLFTRAYCASPLCNPSRTAILTGKRPSSSGVYGNDQPWREALPDVVTLPQHFMAQGYHVMGGGKVFHGRFEEPASWHEYFERPPDPAPSQRNFTGITSAPHFDWAPLDAADEEMGDVKLVDWARSRLDRQWDAPFFLAVGFVRPHLPWYVPRKYFDMYPPETTTLPEVKPDDLDDVPVPGKTLARPEGDHAVITATGNWRNAVAAYLAAVSFLDACVGRLMSALAESPHADNTIVVLWGDHGWHLGEKLHWRKGTLWEESARVPLIIVAPRMTPVGRRCERPVSLLDLYPTLVEACGLEPRAGLEGRSLVPLLKDPQTPWDCPALTTFGLNNHTVRSERWRYIRYRDGAEELYDHENDPMEWTNVAGRPEYAETKQSLARWLPEVNAAPARTEPRSGPDAAPAAKRQAPRRRAN